MIMGNIFETTDSRVTQLAPIFRIQESLWKIFYPICILSRGLVKRWSKNISREEIRQFITNSIIRL